MYRHALLVCRSEWAWAFYWARLADIYLPQANSISPGIDRLYRNTRRRHLRSAQRTIDHANLARLL